MANVDPNDSTKPGFTVPNPLGNIKPKPTPTIGTPVNVKAPASGSDSADAVVKGSGLTFADIQSATGASNSGPYSTNNKKLTLADIQATPEQAIADYGNALATHYSSTNTIGVQDKTPKTESITVSKGDVQRIATNTLLDMLPGVDMGNQTVTVKGSNGKNISMTLDEVRQVALQNVLDAAGFGSSGKTIQFSGGASKFLSGLQDSFMAELKSLLPGGSSSSGSSESKPVLLGLQGSKDKEASKIVKVVNPSTESKGKHTGTGGNSSNDALFAGGGQLSGNGKDTDKGGKKASGSSDSSEVTIEEGVAAAQRILASGGAISNADVQTVKNLTGDQVAAMAAGGDTTIQQLHDTAVRIGESKATIATEDVKYNGATIGLNSDTDMNAGATGAATIVHKDGSIENVSRTSAATNEIADSTDPRILKLANVLNSGGDTSKFTKADWDALHQLQVANETAAAAASPQQALADQVNSVLANPTASSATPTTSSMGSGGSAEPPKYDGSATLAAGSYQQNVDMSVNHRWDAASEKWIPL